MQHSPAPSGTHLPVPSRQPGFERLPCVLRRGKFSPSYSLFPGKVYLARSYRGSQAGVSVKSPPAMKPIS